MTIKMSGTLCYAGHEPGTGIEWMVRNERGHTGRVWVLYRGGVQYSRHGHPRDAHAAYSRYVPPMNDTEASMSR